ncbi:MAG TPA: hypothetical protein PK256_22865, partial [Verrucomicrobiota bacterium]|nr:hypothetical protein [Verrucomicrobiota bacterium]
KAIDKVVRALISQAPEFLQGACAVGQWCVRGADYIAELRESQESNKAIRTSYRLGRPTKEG